MNSANEEFNLVREEGLQTLISFVDEYDDFEFAYFNETKFSSILKLILRENSNLKFS